MKDKYFYPLIFLLTVCLFFFPFFLQGKLPIPSDALVGLYHPYRDFYSKEFPRGMPFKNFLITDPVRQQYPWRGLAIDNEKKGELPLWNPYTFSGTPLLANFQTAAFYPLNVLFWLLPFATGWSVLIILQPILAGIFLYLYLRFMKLSPHATFLGAIVFAFSGFSVAWLEWNTILQTALWLPLILLAKEHLLKKLSVKWMAILIFAQASALLAGHLQTFFYLLLAHNSYLIARIIQIAHNEKKDRLRFALKKYLPFVLYGIVVIAITAIQWYPTLQFILQSGRNVDQINNWQQPGWFIPWQNLIQFVSPDFFGNPTTLNYWGVWNYGEFIGYVGILPLLFALFALYNRQDRKTFFFGVLFFLSLIFSLPTFFAKLTYVLQLPFLSTTQPTRLLFLTDFSLAILAALGFDYFLKTKDKKRILYSVGSIAFIFLGLWFFILFGNKYLQVITPENLAVSKRNLIFPSLILASVAIFISFFLFLEKKHNKKISIALIIFVLIITVADLYRFSQKFNPFTDKAYLYPQTKILSFLQKNTGQFRIMSTASEILPPNFSIIYKIQTLDGYDPLYLIRYGELMAAMGRNKPDIHSPFGFNRIITPQGIDNRLIDLLGVKYVLSLSEISNPTFKKIAQEGRTIVYENQEVSPRAFFATQIIPAAGKNEAITKLFDTKIKLKDIAVVEGWDQRARVFGNGSANIIEYKDNSVTIKTKTKHKGFLVLMDAFYPSWHAEVCNYTLGDCIKSKIYMTNYNFRGVIVPKGEHIVHMKISLL